ncbi:hypothetical protein H6P81_015086 [Aristolochia fimbriata]|uniref:SANT domain-containing protein n=1 Tax=Aristolochia fimbriata TaxID=158543 RepID=A0AAV7E7D8_ARIFI|nr:hypothetical protein H6P81_015086 [Aristolochia fimbriata]
MEVDSVKQVELDHGQGCIEDDPLLSPAPDILDGIYGDPEILPRIGAQYQVEIPPLSLYSTQLIPSQSAMQETENIDCSIQLGLPIPVMWICNVIEHVKFEPLEFNCDTTGVDKSHGDQMEVDLSLPSDSKKTELDDKSKRNNFHPVPGVLGGPWSDFDQECFLLGLYIFGKNLSQVQRFIENKSMGDVLSFYYGKFYKSDGHRRWSESRKIRSRRCIHGQRLFTGWRQQELLSRLISHVSEGQGKVLVEVSKTYNEGKFPFEEYITTLKATVGLKALVEAVGIGKGKHDLTGILLEPTKINQVIPSRPEIPVGKACSTLSSVDIIKFLTGDFRLSKARSNDLFWEAVWPRLLARGWHSEQPKNQGYVNSKNSLVFLIPGVKKFSRRKLVKGNHYFDSVTDVLSKVASEPMLLELDIEVANGGKGAKGEYGWDQDAKLDQMGSSQRHCYLRPRVPNGNQDLMKFTVVDTSMVRGEEPFKVRELRSLPVDNIASESPVSVSRDSDSTSSGEQVDEPDSNDQPESSGAVVTDTVQMKYPRCTLDSTLPSDVVNFVYPPSKQMPGDRSGSTDTLNKNNNEKDIDQGLDSGHPKYLVPVTKRRRLNACSKSDRIHSSTNAFPVGIVSIEEAETCSRRDLSESDAKVADGNMSQQKLSASSFSKVSPDECSASGQSETNSAHQKPQRITLIDLNLPHVPPDFDTGGSLSEGVDSQDGSNTKEASVPSEINQQSIESDTVGTCNGVVSEDQPAARRQSTRNRPLTTRALEALESGFFTTKRRVKGTKVLPDDNSIPRSSRRRARGNGNSDTSKATSKSSGNADNGIIDSKLEGLDEECSSNTNIDLTRSQFQAEKKEAEPLGVLRPAYKPGILTGKENISG